MNTLLYIFLAVVAAVVSYILVDRLTHDETFALIAGLLVLIVGVLGSTTYGRR